jgi:hypothetical protein
LSSSRCSVVCAAARDAVVDSDLRALRHALTDPASRPHHDTTLQLLEHQAIAQQRRPGELTDGVTLRMAGFGLRDASHALLAAATACEHHPRAPSPVRADALRAVLSDIQTQAAGQTLDPPAVRGRAELDLSW